MNEEPDFQHLADDSQDPLLQALRERLGESFGQEPPPAAWAGIRRRLPAAPQPWWRRGRLLPLLALLSGLLLVGGLAVRQARRATRPGPLVARPASPAGASAPAAGSARFPLATGSAGGSGRVHGGQQPGSPTATGRLGTGAGATGVPAPALGTASTSAPLAAATRPSLQGRLANTAAPAAGSGALLITPSQRLAAANRRQSGRLARVAGKGAEVIAARRQAAPAAPGGAPTAAHSAVLASRRQAALAGRKLAGRQLNAAEHSQPASQEPLAAAPRALRPAPNTAALILAQPNHLDSLTSRRPVVALAGIALPSPLAARPDSGQQWPRLGRRWSVLVLAGPALSYRTQVAPWATATQRTLANASAATNYSAGTATSPSIFDLERPALGWGAQAQVRRVLAGRWRLALGAGYQEYATQFNLQIRSGSFGNASMVRPDTVIAQVRQRDTYRLLTLPVQLEYALGPPRGRLALGLLAGLEPSWYVGGRTTENTGCSCQQQAFSGVSGSPYNALSLAFSLGLDARYRLGGPAGRWQLVVQPTGRYIATRFVRGTGLGYALRQPYSLGLLTGLAWDF